MENQNMTEKIIIVGKDFTETPIGRFAKESKFSGETFRQEHLVPALRLFDRVVVDLAGAEGYGSSFLEESFGGVVRTSDFTNDELRRKLSIISSEPLLQPYADRAKRYFEEAMLRRHER